MLFTFLLSTIEMMAFEMFIIDISVWLSSENSTGWQMKANSIIHLVNDKLDDCKEMKMLVCGEWGHRFKQKICVCVSYYFISHIIGKQADKWRKMFGLRKKPWWLALEWDSSVIYVCGQNSAFSHPSEHSLRWMIAPPREYLWFWNTLMWMQKVKFPSVPFRV